MPHSSLSAADVIAMLDLKPHPEGGYFRETFRDPRTSEGRAASTAIYFLLAAGEVSRWHRVDATETWHWYAGAPLQLSLAPPSGTLTHIRLGQALAAGERPQAVVPTRHWQSARSLGAWTLIGCTVAPGFMFEGFELAPDGFEPPA
jgi:predicted cupin superfamily sugar epimerase